jgi:hypothetical protein
MKRSVWNRFVKARDKFRGAVQELSRALPGLRDLQQRLVDERSAGPGAAYRVETPVVYNQALDDVAPGDEISLILVADNPGRREQAAESRRYLTGPSGKIAERFFREHPALGVDFRSNAIILNKTPIHTPRTAELRDLCALGGSRLVQVLSDSQRCMCRLLLDFHRALWDGVFPAVWITGYSEMRKGGIFEAYTETLKDLYRSDPLCDVISVFRHFSMNQFTADLKRQSLKGESAARALARIGAAYRLRILGW